MAASKALRAPYLFTTKGAGTGNLTGATLVTTAVNTGSFSPSGVGLQWKMKELVFTRSASASTDLTLKLVDQKTGAKYVVAQVLAFTTGSARIASNLTSGEYLVDSDCEMEVSTSGMGGGETWNLRVTGQIINHGVM